MASRYRAGDMTLVASGAVEPCRIVRLAEEKFAALRPASAGLRPPAHYVGGDVRLMRIWNRPISPMPFPASPMPIRFLCGQIYATALGGGMSSRLFQEVREKRGLCYSIYAFANSFQDARLSRHLCRHRREREAGEISAVIAGEMEAMTGDPAKPKWPAPAPSSNPVC